MYSPQKIYVTSKAEIISRPHLAYRGIRVSGSVNILPILSLFLCFYTCHLFAEGTKQLVPANTDRIYLYTNSTEYNDFGRYDGNDDQRLYFHIADPSAEQVFLGFSQATSSAHHPCNGSTFITSYFRIKDPTGRVVFPNLGNGNGQELNDVTSNITSYDQAIAGPQPIVGASGYDPFVFDPSGLPSGDYYIEFSRLSNIAALNSPVPIEWFDITVASKTPNPVAIEGRLFSKNFAFFAPSLSCGTNVDYTWFDRPFNGAFYVYTNENIVTLVDFDGAGFQPAAFNVVFNDAGTTQTNDVINDRKSIDGIRSSASQHRIFLNDPDINVYPSGRLGQFSITPKYLVCENGTACVEAVMTEPGQIDVLIDLDTASGDFVYDIGSADVLIAFKVEPEPGELPPYVRCVPWDGIDGFGNKVGSLDDIENVALLTRYTQGIYHFPIYDAEFMLAGFDVTTIRPIPNNGSPKRIYYDDSNILDSYGVGITQPKENPFNGCDIPCHPWSNRDFGDLNTINSWFFAREETVEEVELGGCPIVALPDSVVMFVNTTEEVEVLANDIGTAEIDTTSIVVYTSPENGLGSFDFNSLLASYTPNSGYIGLDSFKYEFCYKIPPVRSLCNISTVYITVLPLPENCLNAADDDGDGMIDCDDPDCQALSPGPINRKQEGLWWMLFLIGFFFFNYRLAQKQFQGIE